MAAVETKWFTKGGKNLVEAEIGWVTGPIHVMLMASGYVFDQDAPEVYTDVAAGEAVGLGYVAGGKVIPNRTVTIDAPQNSTRLRGDPVEWPGSTLAVRGLITYANVGAKPVISYADFVTDRTSENGLFRLEWSANGVLSLQAL